MKTKGNPSGPRGLSALCLAIKTSPGRLVVKDLHDLRIAPTRRVSTAAGVDTEEMFGELFVGELSARVSLSAAG